MKRLWNALSMLGIVLLALTVLLAGLGVYTVRRSFPQASGSARLPGLAAEVEIYRDSSGIPHIYADTPTDLFMAQGYVHAQDRFYQMDFWRHQTSGRLSELYGDATLDADRFLRTVGWQRIAEQEYSLADPESRALLEAYAAGVNAYLAGRPAADLSLEYAILGLNGLSGYRPDEWTPVHTLAWAKAMAWDLGGNMDEEIQRAIMNAQVGVEMTNDYMPLAFPPDHPVIVPTPAVSGQVLENLRARLGEVDRHIGGRFEGIGSNSWVIAGQRTTTGAPLLANDPHLGIQMPSIWYEVGLHCRRLSPDCPFDVTGFSFAGAPGVIIGHNNRIAWGFTNVGPDVQDLVIEKINPANPDQYEVNGRWVDMTLIQETVRVAGGAEVPLTIRYTRHGPIITEVYGLEDFASQAALGEGSYAIALRWTALEVGFIWRSIFNLNQAQNFAEFRDALRDFSAPSQNVIYADVDGHIGYQMPGRIPIRASGDGLLPVPGWTDEFAWSDYIPFDELPYAYDPPEGYIVTANNAVVGPDYPYLITLAWDVGYRARRIVDLIESQPRISPEFMQQMQGDNLNLGAREVLPYLLALHFDDPRLSRAQDALRGWDGQMHMDSQPAAVYMAFFNALLAETFYDDVPEDYWARGGPLAWLILTNLLPQPASAWWDNRSTPSVETRDDILRLAFTHGIEELERRFGEDPEAGTWGSLHTATFENATVGQTDIRPIAALFNRGPYRTSGGSSIVNATGWNLSRDDRDPSSNPYAVGSVPSMRMIVDLGDLDQSLTIHTTGQSGHAFHPHYADMADAWRLIQYHPMLWSRESVEAQARTRLVLTP